MNPLSQRCHKKKGSYYALFRCRYIVPHVCHPFLMPYWRQLCRQVELPRKIKADVTGRDANSERAHLRNLTEPLCQLGSPHPEEEGRPPACICIKYTKSIQPHLHLMEDRMIMTAWDSNLPSPCVLIDFFLNHCKDGHSSRPYNFLDKFILKEELQKRAARARTLQAEFQFLLKQKKGATALYFALRVGLKTVAATNGILTLTTLNCLQKTRQLNHSVIKID
ncbi:hypothetical protein CEXT_571811 [Caerostris extrusa]|uniref:Uncharacterized protein n=1 Tax=Caerostris extrusa TaxID=172846 RepID=A0AAV4PNT0_CAEEX|nr:hypothetical protein CEXT_571811 [Caerostris extrusa]